MPSTYTHYRFGRQVRKKLPASAQKIIDAYPEPFFIGLHGPDILFYYNAYQSNPVNATGYALHEKPASVFFENAKKVINSSENPQAALSYAYGVLCHFALDMTAHPYIEKRMSESGITHAEIEGEFDRYLLALDQHNPTKQVLTTHIVPSKENAKIIYPFYPGITEGQVHKSLNDMILYNRLLLAKSGAKRALMYTLLKLAGKYEELQGLIIKPKGNPRCDESNEQLEKLYKVAKKRAKCFITEFNNYLDGDQELDAFFAYNFEGKMPQGDGE